MAGGWAACQLGGHACRPDGLHHRLPWWRLAFTVGLDLLLVLGLVGIHVPRIAISGKEHMLLGAFSVGAVSAVGMLKLIGKRPRQRSSANIGEEYSSKIHSLLLGDKVDYGIGLSYRPDMQPM